MDAVPEDPISLRQIAVEDYEPLVGAETVERIRAKADAVGVLHVVNRPKLGRKLGDKAKQTVRERFLMTRLMEDWLDLLGSFEPSFRLSGQKAS